MAVSSGCAVTSRTMAQQAGKLVITGTVGLITGSWHRQVQSVAWSSDHQLSTDSQQVFTGSRQLFIDSWQVFTDSHLVFT
ncbi:hypothetical protein LSAT2_026986, partial [Lamellibrachia satsuma]